MRCDIAVIGMDGPEVAGIAAILEAAAGGSGLAAARSPLRREDDDAYVARLRIADQPVNRPEPGGEPADLVLSLDLAAGVRRTSLLAPGAALVTSTGTRAGVAGQALDDLLWSVLQLRAGYLVETGRLACEAGAGGAEGMALLGAACDFLPIDVAPLRSAIASHFRPGDAHESGLRIEAFEAGRKSLRHREIVDEFDTFAPAGH